MSTASTVPALEPAALLDRYRAVRDFTVELCAPLATEDYVVQTMTDVSPTKWHLAHTSWFFETFLLKPHLPAYSPLDPAYAFLFNSYYVQAGARHRRDQRGYLSRPTVREIYDYRAHVDRHMEILADHLTGGRWNQVLPVIEIGLHHEQQHQELILTDIKHVLSLNPLRPAYLEREERQDAKSGGRTALPALRWHEWDEGVYEVGHAGDGFSFDNERPRHRSYLQRFELASRPVTNGDFVEFMEDGGYATPTLWLSEGWATVESQGWREPFYWEKRDGEWWTFTLQGMRKLDPAEPACHLSYFEADAYAQWAGARLPTEQEWEVAAGHLPMQGNLVESRRFHPSPPSQADGGAAAGDLLQIYGDVWEWTRSAYSPYPGFQPLEGALGEYNGKFMCNQYVLRGGSCATSLTHIRPTYRNFFPPAATWQFTGLRLAR